MLSSRATILSARKYENSCLVKSAKNLQLVIENQELKEKNKTLENLRALLDERGEELNKKIVDQEATIRRMQKDID